MSDLRQAAQQALEALEPLVKRACPWGETDWIDGGKAITALRAALAEPEQDKFCDTHCTWRDHHPGCVRAEPEQEPVAFIGTNGELGWLKKPNTLRSAATPLYTAPTPRKPQYDKTEMNSFVQNLYDEKMNEGKHGHYETMFHVVHRAIEKAHGIGEQK